MATPIRGLDMKLVDTLFEMGDGYVLDFNNRSFTQFFEELSIAIDHPRYKVDGDSKAKRLRCLIRTSDTPTRLKVLLALWEYRETTRKRARKQETIPDAQVEFAAMVARLGGKPPVPETKGSSALPVGADPAVSASLAARLLQVSQMAPQARGYEYEKFLQALFAASGMAPRAAFRLQGEQIDGSFDLTGITYLVEAKWQAQRVDAATLRAFNAKVEDKAAWSRGLLISESGFSEHGLAAFGRAKSVICMDGLDLYEVLNRSLSLADVIQRKARRAAEHGTPFVAVRDLFV